MSDKDIINSAVPFLTALNKLGIDYYIGGSFASSLLGFSRTTMDIDFVADLENKSVDELIKLIMDDFYYDEEMIKDAIRNRSSFNIINLDSFIKIDVFIAGRNEYDIEVFKNKKAQIVNDDVKNINIYICSPEDLIIKKLQWYINGNKVSVKQIEDIKGVLMVQKDNLNYDYLFNWCKKLGLYEILQDIIKHG